MHAILLGDHAGGEGGIGDQQHLGRGGKDAITLPTIPSGVTTAIPFCTPLVDPRSTNTTFEFAPVPLPMMRAAMSCDGERA